MCSELAISNTNVMVESKQIKLKKNKDSNKESKNEPKNEPKNKPKSESKNAKNKETKIKNKGTGAGGSNTNNNGLPYEKLTDLDDKIKIIERKKFSETIKFNDNEKLFIKTKKNVLFKCMKDEMNEDIEKAHGCKKPDECYIDKKLKNMFIIEKKFQQRNGSVCEKIQTPDFKLWQYSRTFPDYNIIYIYCFCDWFQKNCKAELEYFDYRNIPYFWGNSETYKDDMINFIINYK